jgi:hypothetical protein
MLVTSLLTLFVTYSIQKNIKFTTLTTRRMVNTFVTTHIKGNLFTNLDKRRLGKQRVEAWQIIKVLEEYDKTGEVGKKGWVNHPATKMWMGYTNALKVYFNLCVKEWIRRGCVNNLALYDVDEEKYRIVPCKFDGVHCEFLEEFDEYCFPPWFSFPPFVLAHRAALLRKEPESYACFDDDQIDEYYDKGYLWPTKAPPSMYEEWKFEYLEPISKGAAQPRYRITKAEAAKWVSEPTVNPATGRGIKRGAKKYREYENVAKRYKLV